MRRHPRSIPLRAALLAWITFLLGLSLEAQPDKNTGAVLWTLRPQGLSAAEQALAASLQGLLNRSNATLWFKGPGAGTWVLEELQREGMTVREAGSVWELVEQFRDRVAGYITCNVTNASLNAATSLAGIRTSVVADLSLRDRLHRLGLREQFDARGLNDAALIQQFGSEFVRSIAVHQPVQKPLHLRDFAVSHRALTFFDVSSVQRQQILRGFSPGVQVFGWGLSEREFVGDVSAGGGVVIPADWALNLSALEHLDVPIPPRPLVPPPRPLQDGERVVAFVVTDGDNVQWLLNGFVESTGFWASPHRGRFAVTWELAPELARLAPRVLARLFRTATDRDDFVAGPSGIGYYFPSLSPSADTIARQTAGSLPPAQLQLVSVLNAEGGLDAADPVVGQSGVAGVLYKDYAPYNRFRGNVRWHDGKPIVSYRHLLWEQRRPDGSSQEHLLPAGVAAAIARGPATAAAGPERFSLVNVHAWSFRDSGGPMGAISRTIELLPPGTRVVTATEFFELLSQSRGHSGGPAGRSSPAP